MNKIVVKKLSIATAFHEGDKKVPLGTDHAPSQADEYVKNQGGSVVESLLPKEFDALGFYSRAYIICVKFIQQQEDVLHLLRRRDIKMSAEVKPPVYHSVEGVDVPRSVGAASLQGALVNSFALLLSKSRNSTKASLIGTTSASQVTATALQRSDRSTGGGACQYTLYVAKNGHISPGDLLLMKSMKKWMNWVGGNENLRPDNKSWCLVTTHIYERIQSYLSFMDDIKTKKCLPLLQDAPFGIPGDTNIQSCLSDLRDLLTGINDEDTTNFSSQSAILFWCYEFTQSHADDISDLMASLQKSGGRGSHILFVIIGINRLAKVPRAFRDIFKFRKSCITKDKDQFDIVPVGKCDESSQEPHPGLCNVKSYIKELMRNPAYDHIKKELGEIVKHIKAKPSMEYSTMVHCEIQLLDYILQQATMKKLKLGEMYSFIGCSKKPCFLCAGTINLGTSFEMAASHWKLYDAWGLPKALLNNEKIVHALSSLWYKMDETLKDEILRPSRAGSTNIENNSPKGKSIDLETDWDWIPALVPESPVVADFEANHREAPDEGKIEEIDQLLVDLGLITPK